MISAAGAFLKENPKGTLIDFLCETSLGEPAFDSEKENSSEVTG